MNEGLYYESITSRKYKWGKTYTLSLAAVSVRKELEVGTS